MDATEAKSFSKLSAANAALVAEHFTCGCEPYDQVLTYKRWQALGFQVQKGEKGFRIPTLVPQFDEEGEFTRCRPVTAILFCACQVAPIEEVKSDNGSKQPEVAPAKPKAPKPKKKSSNGKVKPWRQTKPDVWLRKARGRDDARPALTQIHSTGGSSVSTDGFRLHLIPDGSYGETVENFPSFGEIVKSAYDNSKAAVIVSSRHLRKAAEHSKAMSKITMRLDFSKEQLVFSAKGDDGENSVTIEDGEGWNGSGPAVYMNDHDEEISIALNPKYFLEAIMGMQDVVTLRVQSKSQPIHITDGDRVAVIMPMSLGR